MDITMDQALGLLTDMVDEHGEDAFYEKPDSSYQDGCWYQHDGTEPGCLIGRILHDKLDVSLDVLKAMDEADSSTFDDSEVQALLSGAGLNFSSEAVQVLRLAQIAQDFGQPWGYARERAYEASQNIEEGR